MATVGDYFNTANHMQLINSNMMAMLNRLNTVMLQNRPPVIDCVAQMSVSLSAIATAASEFERKYEPQLNLMKPEICSAVQMAAQLSSLVQPQLDLLQTLAPTVEQFSTLLQQVASVTNDIGSICEEDISALSSEEWEETDQAANEILADPDSWEQKPVSKIMALKKSHPKIAKAAVFVLAAVCEHYFDLGLDAFDAKVKELFTTDAPAIMETASNQPAVVIDFVPGYYKIMLHDPQTGETEIGWIADQFLQNLKEPATDTDAAEENREKEKAQAEPEPSS